MRKSLLAAALFLPSLAFGQSAVVSTNPPDYTSGAQSLSQTLDGGLRVQPMDGQGHDVGPTNPLYVSTITSTQGHALPTVSSSAVAPGLVLKASAAVVYGAQVMNPSGAVGLLMLFNSATVPADGAVTPVKCWNVPVGTSVTVQFNPPLAFDTGASVAFSSGTDCFAKTGVNAFFSGEVK